MDEEFVLKILFQLP